MLIAVIAVAFLGCKKDAETEKPKVNPNQGSGTFTKQIDDGSFENGWFTFDIIRNGNKEVFDDYKSATFLCLNKLRSLLDDNSGMDCNFADLTAYADPNGHTGKCMKLVSGRIQETEESTPVFLPGAMATISSTFINEFVFGGAINVKRPYTETPVAVKGYWKYTPVAGDSASICVELYHNNDLIGIAKQVIKNDISDWTAFNIPMVMQGEGRTRVTPTHIAIVCSASAGYNFDDLLNCRGQVGSTLWLDDLQLEF